MTDESSTSIRDLMVVDNAQKIAGIMKLLTAFKPIDISKAQKIVVDGGELSRDDFYRAYPGLTSSPLADDLGLVVLAPSSVAEFMLNAIAAMGALAQAFASFAEFTNTKQLQALVQAWEDYNVAPSGSVAEVNARQTYEALMEDINETVLRTNPKLYAAFEDPECGFVAAAAATFNGDLDGDEEDDEEDDEDCEANADLIAEDDDEDDDANSNSSLN
jgi:hypothetical protein